MNRLDGFDRLLTEFGESIGIPEMAFDEDGLCHIRVDEEYPITFRRDDENHNLVLVGLIAEELRGELDQALVREMLATGVEPLRNHGAALGLEPQSGTLILHQTMPLAKMNRPMLEEMLGNFILLQKDWTARIAAVEQASPTSGAVGQSAAAVVGPMVGPVPGQGGGGARHPAANSGASRQSKAGRPASTAAGEGMVKRPGGDSATAPNAGPAQRSPATGGGQQGDSLVKGAGDGPAGDGSGKPRVHPDLLRR